MAEAVTTPGVKTAKAVNLTENLVHLAFLTARIRLDLGY